MLTLGILTKVKVFFLVLVYLFNIDLFELSAAILEKGLLRWQRKSWHISESLRRNEPRVRVTSRLQNSCFFLPYSEGPKRRKLSVLLSTKATSRQKLCLEVIYTVLQTSVRLL